MKLERAVVFNPINPLNPVNLGQRLGRAIGRRISPQPEPQRTPPRRETPQRPPQTPQRHPTQPRATTFQNVPPLNAQAQELRQAILAYPDTHATPAQATQIARETDAAARAFGVEPRVMLAIFAHESGGFDVRAESHSGAKGLGQLTGVAIQEMRRLSDDPTYRQSYPRSRAQTQSYDDPEVRAVAERPAVQATFQRLGRSEENRYNVKDNIWGSAFYARISMDRAQQRGGAAVVLGENGMMGRYNGASMSERRAHSAGIADAYQRMFGQAIPATLRPGT